MLTAGALALAVIAPALDSVEHAAEAATTQPQVLPTTPEAAVSALRTGPSQRAGLQQHDVSEVRLAGPRQDADLGRRAVAPESARLRARLVTGQRASRSGIRRTVAVQPAVPSRTVTAAQRARQATSPALRKVRAAQRTFARDMRSIAGSGKRVVRTTRQRVVQQRRVLTNRSTVLRRTNVRQVRDMRAVIAFARSQVGARYVSGGEGRGGFDCSGFTKRAYARIGLHLPHSSGAQAARARIINRAQARPGDLVVGRGHVGIYMGQGMMIDAGNRRTGVVYRKVYRGLSVARL